MLEYIKMYLKSIEDSQSAEGRSIWIGDSTFAACIDPAHGRLYATISNYGDSKHYPTFYVSVIEAFRMWRREDVVAMRWTNCMTVAVEICRRKFRSMQEAQTLAEIVIDDYGIWE